MSSQRKSWQGSSIDDIPFLMLFDRYMINCVWQCVWWAFISFSIDTLVHNAYEGSQNYSRSFSEPGDQPHLGRVRLQKPVIVPWFRLLSAVTSVYATWGPCPSKIRFGTLSFLCSLPNPSAYQAADGLSLWREYNSSYIERDVTFDSVLTKLWVELRVAQMGPDKGVQRPLLLTFLLLTFLRTCRSSMDTHDAFLPSMEKEVRVPEAYCFGKKSWFRIK